MSSPELFTEYPALPDLKQNTLWQTIFNSSIRFMTGEEIVRLFNVLTAVEQQQAFIVIEETDDHISYVRVLPDGTLAHSNSNGVMYTDVPYTLNFLKKNPHFFLLETKDNFRIRMQESPTEYREPKFIITTLMYTRRISTIYSNIQESQQLTSPNIIIDCQHISGLDRETIDDQTTPWYADRDHIRIDLDTLTCYFSHDDNPSHEIAFNIGQSFYIQKDLESVLVTIEKHDDEFQVTVQFSHRGNQHESLLLSGKVAKDVALPKENLIPFQDNNSDTLANALCWDEIINIGKSISFYASDSGRYPSL